MTLRRTSALCAFVVLLLTCGVAAARPVVAVAPFRGPYAAPLEETVQRSLRPVALVLAPRRYALVAKGLFAQGGSPEDIAAVAHDLGADFVVTGTVKLDKGEWSLAVSLRDGATGRPRARLHYPLPSPRVPDDVMQTLEEELVGALATAINAPSPDEGGAVKPPPGAGNEQPQTEQPAEHNNFDFAKPASAPTAKPAETTPTPAVDPNKRPGWARWFELGVGAALTGRKFAIDPPPPRFSSAIVGGIHAEGTLYPLAGTWRRARGAFSGLGLHIEFDRPFWPPSTSKSDPTKTYATSEIRIEGGLHWKFTLLKGMPRPQLTLIIDGGTHQFLFPADANGTSLVGVPNVQYVYASIGGGLTIHFKEWAWLWTTFVYHAVTNSGPIQYPQNYGLAATFGLRFSAGLDFLVWRGIRLGANGFYERFQDRFGYDPAHRTIIATGSTDEYYGLYILAGYVF